MDQPNVDIVSKNKVEELFNSNIGRSLRTAGQVALGVPPGARDPLEIKQAALLGLWESARRYNEQDGVKFYTYAERRIRGSIKDAIHFNSSYWSPKVGYNKMIGLSSVGVKYSTLGMDLRRLINLTKLSANESTILNLYLEGYTTGEIGKKLGKAQETCCRTLQNIIRKLRYSYVHTNKSFRMAS